MKLKRAQTIAESYQRIEDDDPDISTERLLAMVHDETGADADDVITALKMVDK